jgi:peptidoglycan/LPS O-acetylase OafA/YrhL
VCLTSGFEPPVGLARVGQVRVDAPERGRVAGLDGLRGLAALYVAVFHCWLLTFRGFPANTGPGWLGWTLYGHLAVVFFLALSGFSLAMSPARNGWRLGGTARYARRRAWRILPPYWAALVFGLLVAWAITPQPHSGPVTGRSVLVYGLLLQDVTRAPVPNGAFWSIAVEAELYVLFPLLLLIRRRLGAAVLIAAVTVPVIAVGLLRPAYASVSPVDKWTWLTPQLAPLFVFGMVGAGILAARDRLRRLPWQWITLLAATPPLALIVIKGSVWTVTHYFWLDLAIGPAMALLLVAVSTGRPAPLTWLLATRPVRGLGRFSYSLYLIHLPIVWVINRKLAVLHLGTGLPTFWATLGLAIPVSLAAAWLFASVFEIPFQRYRGWSALRAAALARWGRLTGNEVPPPLPQLPQLPQPRTPEPLAPSHRPETLSSAVAGDGAAGSPPNP